VNKICLYWIIFTAQSGVEIRFHVDSATWIPDWIRENFKKQVRNEIIYLYGLRDLLKRVFKS
jgi:hypothetical protein